MATTAVTQKVVSVKSVKMRIGTKETTVTRVAERQSELGARAEEYDVVIRVNGQEVARATSWDMGDAIADAEEAFSAWLSRRS